MTKYLLALIGAVILGVAIYGAYQYPQMQAQLGSPVGSTFNQSKQIAVVMAPLTAGATSTSILNTDGSPRWVADFGFAGCTGLGSSYTYPNTSGTGLAALLVQAATTSIPNQGLQANTNYALNLTVSTSSSVYTQSSTSTVPAQAGFWDTNTYMTFVFNATSTGTCVVEMDYIPS